MGIVTVIIDQSANITYTGVHVYDRASGGTFVGESGAAFPGTPVAGEWFWRTDESKLYRRDSANTSWVAVLATPAAHASSHGFGGTDVVTLAQSQVTNLGTDLAGKVPTARQVATSGGLQGGGDLTADRTLSPVYGTAVSTVCQGNDGRLSDSRSPTIHASTHKNGGTDEVATATPGAAAIPKADSSGKLDSWVTADAAAATSSLRKLGTSATSACAGNDSRLSDSRTPSAHASTHAAAGSDAVTLAQSQVTGLTTDLVACEKSANKNAASGYAGLDGSSKLTGSQQVYGTAANTACVGNDARLSDDRTASGLRSATTVVAVSSATAPSLGQVLTATSGSAATWQTPVTGTDINAIHKNVAAEISTITEKTVPVAADLLVIEDSAASNAKKRLQVGNLPNTNLFKQSAMTEVAADLSTTSSTWADLLTLNITTGVGFLIMQATAGLNCSNASSRIMGIRLMLDGVAVRAVSSPSVNVNVAQALGLLSRKAVTAGAHVVKVQWQVSSGYTLYCRPVTVPDQEHCTLVVQEVGA
jgi:hypothetical protein